MTGPTHKRLHLLPDRIRFLVLGAAVAAVMAASVPPAASEALLLVEADTGKVLHAEQATVPWYPASVTKLMTTYVALRAIRERRLGLDTLLTVSANAAAQQPSKMGFKPGTKITVDNVLKMLLVKSANDMAVVLAEGVSGSIDKFAVEMNRAAQRLGMTQSNFVNPNGLPADGQVTSARDLAILARALISEFPEYDFYWHIPAIKLGRKVMHTYNMLIDRYPGADGMKTGFICSSGFNLVATATHGDRRLIAVVLGAPSAVARAEKAAQLFEKGFAGNALAWLLPALGTVDALTPVATSPPDLHEEMCGKDRHRAAASEDEPAGTNGAEASSAYAAWTLGNRTRSGSLLGPLTPSMPPIEVFVGPPRRSSARALATVAPAKPNPSSRATPTIGAVEPTLTAPTAQAAPSAPDAAAWVSSLFNPAPTAAAAGPNAAVPMPRPRPGR